MCEVENLETMDRELWQNVSAGLSASAAIILLNHQYYGVADNKDLFRGNISNTLVYKTLESISKQSVVCTFQTLKTYRDHHPEDWFDIRGYVFLRHHRDQAFHSESAEWKDDPAMLEFFSKEMCYLRATRLYQARQSVLNRISMLRETHSNRPENLALPTEGIVKMIRTAMENVIRDGIYLDPDFDELIQHSFQVVSQSIAEKARQKTTN